MTMTASTEQPFPRLERVLSLAGTALVLAFGALVATSVIETRRVAASLEIIRSELRPRAEAAYEMEINLLEVSDAMDAFLADKDTSRLRILDAERRQLQGAVGNYLALGKSGLEDTPDRTLRALMSEFDAMSLSLEQTVRVNDAQSPAITHGRAMLRELQSRIASHLDVETQPAAIKRWHVEADRVLALSQRQRIAHVFVAVLGTAVVLLGGILALRAHRSIDQARADAELSSRQKGEFASITAHELRSPLNAILGSVQLLRLGRMGPLSGEAERYLDMATRNSMRLMALIDELLELDKLEAGMLPMAREPVNLCAVVQHACGALEATAAEREITVHTELASTRSVTGDAGRLGQVVTNLLSNALKHAPDDSEVVARVEDTDHSVRVSIADRGPGIAPADSERIFQRFVQTGPARKHSTGLGLTIAREIIHRHSGRIGVVSQLGQGATFWFELPARP